MVVHLYGVIASDADLSRELRGRGGVPVRAVADERLAVLVSDLDLDAGVGRTDLLSHAHVLEAVAEHSTVIPMQFGVVMQDDETVRREVLDAGGDRTVDLLRAFDGLVQLSVSGRYDEEAAFREVVRREPELGAMCGSGDVPNRVYPGEVVAALEQLRADDSDLLLQRLAPHARAVAFNETRDAYSVTGLSLLVERDTRAALDRAVSEVRDELSGRLHLRCVGAQPPYAFVEAEERPWAERGRRL